MEHFKIKLDCKLGDHLALLEHQSAFMVATAMHNTYHASKDELFGIGPELYAEQWMRNFVTCSKHFEDLIVIYFIKILQGVQKNGKRDTRV